MTSVPPHTVQPTDPGASGWRVLARAIAVLHMAFALFVVAGSLLVLNWPGLMWIHLAAVAWAIATMGFDLGCPLTPWEKRSWIRGGRVPYEEGFLQHHILGSRFDPANSRRDHIVLGVTVLVLNAVVYAFVLRQA